MRSGGSRLFDENRLKIRDIICWQLNIHVIDTRKVIDVHKMGHSCYLVAAIYKTRNSNSFGGKAIKSFGLDVFERKLKNKERKKEKGQSYVRQCGLA